jgi:hypothetical protein
VDLWLRIACDVVTGAACVHALSVHPRRCLPGPDLGGGLGGGIGFIAPWAFNTIPGLWWWVRRCS